MEEVDVPYCTCATKPGKSKSFTQSNQKYWFPRERRWVNLWVCATCKKPTIYFCSRCEVCEELFVGKYPFLKFAYPCPDCE